MIPTNTLNNSSSVLTENNFKPKQNNLQRRTRLVGVAIILAVGSLWLLGCGGKNETDKSAQEQAQQAQQAQTTRAQQAASSIFAYDADEILRLRRAKDEYFRTDSLAPLPVFDKERFSELPYYAPNPAYCVNARFEPLPEEKPVIVETTSSADYRRMQRVGRLHFRIGADSCTLTGYVDVDAAKELAKLGAPPVLAVYFKDATNSNTTYEAGRYLELPYREGALAYTLDFNRAFSPFCAFNTLYSCPLVPRENILRLSIEAGEKTYQKP